MFKCEYSFLLTYIIRNGIDKRTSHLTDVMCCMKKKSEINYNERNVKPKTGFVEKN